MLGAGASGDAHGEHAGENDGEHEERLDFDWRPEPLTVVDPNRMFRWPIVIAALFIGVSVALIIRLFVAAPSNGAAERLEEYRAVASDLAAALLTTLDAPTGDTDAVARLVTAVDQSRETVAQPLPGGTPLAGQGAGAELAAAHERFEGIIESADALVRRLQISSSYRSAAAVVLAVPLLPSEAPDELVDAAARALDDYQAVAGPAAAGLGTEPEMADFRRHVAEHLDALPTWSELYLLALRRGDAEATASLLTDLRERVDVARSELDDRLGEIEDGVTAEILALLAALRDAGLVAPE